MATVKEQYNRARRNLQRKINEAKKRGYIFADNVLPKRPKTVTPASIRRLQKISAELYENAEYQDPMTGERVSGRRGRRYERERATQKAQRTRKNKPKKTKGPYDIVEETDEDFTETETPSPWEEDEAISPSIIDIVYNWVATELRNWKPLPNWSEWWASHKRSHKNTLDNIFYGRVNEEGKAVVAQRLEAHSTEVYDRVWRILYGSDDDDVIQADLVAFAAIIKGSSLTVDESMDITDTMEFYAYQ